MGYEENEEKIYMSEFKYEITRRIKILSDNGKGWTKELNMVSWNGRDPKLDIREWNHGENRMGKGITLSIEEKDALLEALNEI